MDSSGDSWNFSRGGLMATLDRMATLWQRWNARRKAATDLLRTRCLADLPGGPVVFSVVRNESLRLPRFLDHYRALGASHFVVVDNSSSDGTADLLLGQPDVCLYTTDSHFCGKEAWLDHLLRQHGRDRWCVVVDADELLVYPDSDRVKLPDLCRHLEETHSNAVHAILLDLYPRELAGEADYEPGQDYLGKPWFFDPFSSLRKVPRHFFHGSGLDFRFEGGSRERIFGVAACCSKFPLFHYRPGMFLTDGQHYLEGGHFSEFRAVLYHFKYLQDFVPHIREEVVRGQHWKGALEYKAYAETLSREGDGFRIANENSIRLEDTGQLENLGFLVRPPSYDGFVGKAATA